MSVQMRCHFIDDASGYFVQCWVAGCTFPLARLKEPDPEEEPLFPGAPSAQAGGGERQCKSRKGLGWGQACWMPRNSVILTFRRHRKEGAGAEFGLNNAKGLGTLLYTPPT